MSSAPALLRRLALAVLLISPLAGCRRSPAPTASSHVAIGAAAAGAYRDVAAQSGIDFAWGHGGRSPLDIQETIGHGCSFIDYDQDGLMDVLFAGMKHCALYRNEGGGRFADVTAHSGFDISGKLCGVAVGDYDNDGYPDLYITGYGACALYRNRGPRAGPIFANVTAQAGVGALGPYDFATAAAFADLDNDGRLDLIACRYVKFTPRSPRFVLKENVRTGYSVQAYEPATSHVYRNNGDGTFSDATKVWGFDALHGRCLGQSVAADDSGRGVKVYFANDELPCDLMVRNGARYVNAAVNSGTAYGSEGMRQAGMGCDWGDFDNDGRPDLIVGTFRSEAKPLYRCTGPGLFTDVGAEVGLRFGTVPYITFTAKFLDYDCDGWLDVFMASGHVQDNAGDIERGQTYRQPLLLYRNEAGRRLQLLGMEAGAPFQTPIVGRGASVGDFDNDGRPDLLLANDEGKALLLHNQISTRNHWLGIRLVGTHCNRDGIGARVSLAAGDARYVRDQQLVGGYVSGQDPRLKFGLGSATRVDRIEVRWPDGDTQVVSGTDPRLRADQYVTVRQRPASG